MSKTKLAVVFLIVSLLLSAWISPGPSPSGEGMGFAANPPQVEAGAKLNIDNKTGATLAITLTGPRSYTLTANPGKNIFHVEPGKYRYDYKACGTNKSGTLTIGESKGGKLAIAKCVTANVTVVNESGNSMRLILSGPTSYQFTLQPGKTKIKVIKGKYNYQAYLSCGSASGSVNLGKGGNWRWWCT